MKGKNWKTWLLCLGIVFLLVFQPVLAADDTKLVGYTAGTESLDLFIKYPPENSSDISVQIGSDNASGFSIQKIFEINKPVVTVILVDNAIDKTVNQKRIRETLDDIIDNKLDNEEISIVVCSPEFSVIQDFTKDTADLKESIRNIRFNHEKKVITLDALKDGLDAAMNCKLDLKAIGRVVLVTNCAAGQQYDLRDIEKSIAETGSQVFVIDYSPYLLWQTDLKKLAQISNGRYFSLPEVDLKDILTTLGQVQDYGVITRPLEGSLGDGSTKQIRVNFFEPDQEKPSLILGAEVRMPLLEAVVPTQEKSNLETKPAASDRKTKGTSGSKETEAAKTTSLVNLFSEGNDFESMKNIVVSWIKTHVLLLVLVLGIIIVLIILLILLLHRKKRSHKAAAEAEEQRQEELQLEEQQRIEEDEESGNLSEVSSSEFSSSTPQSFDPMTFHEVSERIYPPNGQVKSGNSKWSVVSLEDQPDTHSVTADDLFSGIPTAPVSSEEQLEDEKTIIDAVVDPAEEHTTVLPQSWFDKPLIRLTNPEDSDEVFEQPIDQELIIGRTLRAVDKNSGIKIENKSGRKDDPRASISGKHCKILDKDKSFFIRDLNSSNGTFINGLRVLGETQIHDGDELKLGRAAFIFHVNLSNCNKAQ